MDTQDKLDLRGAIIPFTVLKVSLAFRTIGVGDSLEVLWSDPDTAGHLFKVLPAASFDLVTMDETIQDQPCYRVILVKRA